MGAARRSVLGLALAGAAAGAAILWRGRRLPAERVDLYCDDGSLVTFEGNSPEAASLLPLARQILDAAR